MALAVLLSLSVHALLVVGAYVSVLADVEPFEIADPTEIELGMLEDIEVAGMEPVEAVEAPPETPPTPAAPEAEDPESEGTADAGPEEDASIEDAGLDADDAADADAEIADAGVDADAELDADVPDADAGDAELDAGDASADAASLVASALPDGGDAGSQRSIYGPSRLPPGSTVAIRVDLERVRGGVFERPVRDLISTIGEWTILLEGSGVDPLADFDQIFLATPNPQQFGKIAIAGRHRHDSAWVRARAEELARLRGQTIEWRQEQGVWRAPWWSRDSAWNPRIVAILGPHHFAVCREEDLPRLLTLAQYRARRPRSDGVVLTGPDALLSMSEGEALSLEASNIRAFVRGAPAPVPASGRVAVSLDAGNVGLDALASYDDAQGSEEGAAQWGVLVRRFGPLIGLQRATASLRFTPEAENVTITGSLDEAEARMLLGAMRDLFAARRERQELPPVTPAAP